MQAGTRVGEVLASKYRLEELLGSGGMGHVYRAVNVEIERAVAIKVLRSEHMTNASIVERFLREARAANLVRHPNVVDVVDVGRDGDGSPFIVQELLTGEDLSKFVERRGGKLTLDEIEELVLPVIDAVAEAHARGVVHRDIKPENVFLAAGPGGRRIPKLLDFGISKVRLPNLKVTEVGVMMGTPAYMAPEQIQGSRDTDPRSDIWALGIMLYELLAGRLPFDAMDAPQLFVAIATKDVPRLGDLCPEVGPSMSLLVMRCLRRTPEERYPTALELARDLRHVLDGADVEPTLRRSIPPAALTPRDLDIPDLIFPGVKNAGVPSIPSGSPEPRAAKTLSQSPAALGLHRTELSTGGPPMSAPAPGSVPDLVVQARPPASAPNLPSAPALVSAPAPGPAPAPAPRAKIELSSGSMSSAPSSSPSQSAGRLAADQSMPGMMLTGPSTTSPRRPDRNAYFQEAPRQAPGPDMALLVGLAVIGLTSIGVTALLMTFAYQPEGWQLVALITKPNPTMSLVVHGGLAVVAFVFAARMAVSGLQKWRGTLEGGGSSAIFSAILAGGFFFAALQLARAAW